MLAEHSVFCTSVNTSCTEVRYIEYSGVVISEGMDKLICPKLSVGTCYGILENHYLGKELQRLRIPEEKPEITTI